MKKVSISALSDRIAQRDINSAIRSRIQCFNIRSFGSNCSAYATSIAHIYKRRFQYPLFRIELLSAHSLPRLGVAIYVSISALSDRIAQHQRQRRACRLMRVSISALSDRIAQLWNMIEDHCTMLVSLSALSDRIAQQLIAPSVYLFAALFQYPLFRIELLSAG